MANALAMVNGVPRATISAAPYIAAYSANLTVVASGATTGQINGPVNAGVSVTLPNSQTYNSTELDLFLNGQKLENVIDYTYVGSAPRTQVQFTFQLVVGDVLEFRIDRSF